MAMPGDRPVGERLGVDLSRAFRTSLALDRDRAGPALVERALGSGVAWIDCGARTGVPDIERRSAAALARVPQGASTRVSTTLSGELDTGGASPSAGRPDPARGRPLFEGSPAEWPRALEEAVDRAIHRLARRRLSIAWIDSADARGLRDPAVRRMLEAMREEGGPLDAWGIRLAQPLAGPDAHERVLALHPPFLAVPLHLLNARDALGFARDAAGAGTRVIATDPFAGGLLDGSWFAPPPPAARLGPSTPPTWGQLRDRFEPVRRLGYLTADRRRTLPQAALQFLWGSSELDGVLIAPRDANELAAALAARAAPPLSETERGRVMAGFAAPGPDGLRAAQIGGGANQSL